MVRIPTLRFTTCNKVAQASGTLEPSMTSELLQHCDEHKLAEERQLIQGAAAVAYRGPKSNPFA